ncbi:MAG TPA: membrane protein insertase YidC [Bacteroidales bacterium]|nr:membrane protein insertase YidC [Bacteroidales bacterium]
MDKNTIIGLVLIFLVFITFSLFNSNKLKKSYESAASVADSLYEVGNYEAARLQYLKALEYKPGTPEAVNRINEINNIIQPDTISPQDTVKREQVTMTGQVPQTVNRNQEIEQIPQPTGAFSSAYSGEQEFFLLKNDLLELTIATRGGRIYSALLKEYTTHDQRPLILFDGDSTVFGFKFFTRDNKRIETNNLYFKPVNTSPVTDASNSAATATFRLEVNEDQYIEYIYSLEPGQYMVGFDVNFVGLTDILASNISSLAFDWKSYLPQQEKGKQNENNWSNIKYKHYQDNVDGFRTRSQKDFEENDIATPLRWVAFKDQFFSSVIISDKSFSNGYVSYTKMPLDSKYLRYCTTELSLPYEPHQNDDYKMSLYFGPNHYKTLKKHGLALEELVMVGKNIIKFINKYVIVQIFNWLNKYIGNYGIIILILTLIIKVVLFPLTFKSYQSQAKMKVLKPLVDEINKKYPKKEDAMKKQQATMDMYKKAGVSPLGGCLPMALQMPILFAMFRFFPTSIELRQQSFLWAKDLSTYDSIMDLPFNIPMYGDHISLFTLLMTISTIVTMKINSPSSTGQEQMPGMKMMTYIMPVMFMFILNNFSSGLTYYYFLANLITFGQNMLSKRFIDEEAVLKKLNENKKKTPKKSKFQQRLKEAAKQRGYQAPKRK